MAEGATYIGRAVAKAKVLVVSEEMPQEWKGRQKRDNIGDHVRLICQPFNLKPKKDEMGCILPGIC